MVQTCFITEQILHRMNLHISHPEEDTVAEPNQGSITMLNIDSSISKRCVGIRTELNEAFKSELVQFLRENVSTFTWSMDDMKGIHLNITYHELDVDPTYKPIKQKRGNSVQNEHGP